MHALLLVAFFTCHYPGYINHPCQRQLARTVRYMRQHPNTVVVMVNGDDETGEYLAANGIDPFRISESKQAHSNLILQIRRAPKVKLIAPLKVVSQDPRDYIVGCP